MGGRREKRSICSHEKATDDHNAVCMTAREETPLHSLRQDIIKVHYSWRLPEDNKHDRRRRRAAFWTASQKASIHLCFMHDSRRKVPDAEQKYIPARNQTSTSSIYHVFPSLSLCDPDAKRMNATRMDATRMDATRRKTSCLLLLPFHVPQSLAAARWWRTN
jgi:hypothetical protein